MTLTEQYALDLAQRIVAERETERKVPTVATLRDISSKAIAEISEALEALTEAGVLHRSENVNRIPMYAPKHQP